MGGASEGSPNPVYGNFTDPNEPGSGGAAGGGSGWRGGNGGGLVRIVAQVIQLDGSIVADGGDGSGGEVVVVEGYVWMWERLVAQGRSQPMEALTFVELAQVEEGAGLPLLPGGYGI